MFQKLVEERAGVSGMILTERQAPIWENFVIGTGLREYLKCAGMQKEAAE